MVRIRPIIVSTLCAITLLMSCGCLTFEANYNRAKSTTDPNNALVGAWAGRWSFDGSNAANPARAVISRCDRQGVSDIWIEMSAYRHIAADWIQVNEVSVHSVANTLHFHARVPLDILPKENIRALAIELDGQLRDDVLTITFRTNDAMATLDSGTIRLVRQRTRSDN